MDQNFIQRLRQRGASVSPGALKQLKALWDAGAEVPKQFLFDTFKAQADTFRAEGFNDAQTETMLRYQFVYLLTQAAQEDGLQRYADKTAEQLLRMVVSTLQVLNLLSRKQDQRLDSLERWRGVVVAGWAQLGQLWSRVVALEARPVPPNNGLPQVGPTFEEETNNNGAVELARFRLSTDVDGVQMRRFIVQARNESGGAVLYGDAFVTWHVEDGVGPVFDSLFVHTSVSTGAVLSTQNIAFGTSEPIIALRGTGQLAAGLMTWQVFEVASHQFPDPVNAIHPLYQAS